MRYTSADFMRIAEAWELQEEGGHRDAVKIIRAALRIASRVMAEGVLEGDPLSQISTGAADMTHDPRLVEALARAIRRGRNRSAGDVAADCLSAIDASGTHWVAPTKITLDGFSQSDLDAMRTAYLAEQPDKDGR